MHFINLIDKHLKLEMKRHKTKLHVINQIKQQKVVNKYQSHLPIRAVSIKILSNQRT